VRRREFLKLAGAAVAGGVSGGWPGAAGAEPAGAAGLTLTTDAEVAHILPTVSHDRMLVKVSFFEPQHPAPELRVGNGVVAGQQTDSAARFWQFDVDGLDPQTGYELELRKDGCAVFEPWQLSTFPDPASAPGSFRLLVFTCAGGHDIFNVYVPMPLRRRLLRRALEFAPDAALAIGDHIYWDLRSLPGSLILGDSSTAKDFAGELDRASSVLGTANERILTRAVDAQIASLYGTIFRSLPVYFARDDHDYFEDDRVTDALTTFPPDPFSFDLARSAQRLYYPEFLPDPTRPSTLPDSGAADRPPGTSETFGTLRYGKLVEALVYDCKGYITGGGAAGRFVPGDVEAWLMARMAGSDAAHVVNVPGNPMGWSAGKFVEWYPDVVVGGQLTTSQPKDGWNQGWLDQHDRILQAAAARTSTPLVLSGDMHSIAETRITRTGSTDLSHNPVVSLISATPGTGRFGWPSIVRGTKAGKPAAIDTDPIVPVEEVNGFHIVDFEPGGFTIRHFRWDIETESPDAIDSLMPFHVSVHT